MLNIFHYLPFFKKTKPGFITNKEFREYLHNLDPKLRDIYTTCNQILYNAEAINTDEWEIACKIDRLFWEIAKTKHG